MYNDQLLKYGKYISGLISSVVRGTCAPEPFEGINWKKLFHLAQKHNVAVMIYSALNTATIPEDVALLFKKEKNLMLSRTTRQNIEAELIMQELEKHTIRYIKLKGMHIKEYYPLNYMRNFGDIDLYVSKEDREKAKSIMANLGYTLENSIGYHDEYTKDNFYIFEIHSDVVNYTMKYAPIFEDPFSKSVLCKDSSMCYVLDNEHLYMHLVCHLYNHFIKTGCGIRLFADLLVFEEKVKDVDYDYVEAQLKKYGMLDFLNVVRKLNCYFFGDAEPDKDTLTIASYILSSETNGEYKNIVANYKLSDKAKRIAEDLFPSAKRLAYRYPILNKAPILLPVCWIRRGFYTLFFKRYALKNQINAIKAINSEENKEIKKVRDIADKNSNK